MKLSEYFKYDHQETDSSEFKTKKILKTLYKGVKIPWLLIILGAFLAVFNSIVILTQYDNNIAIFTGTMSDLSPLVAYLTASFIQYLLIFASVISDIALVKIVTGIRKKMWRKIMHLPLTDYDESQNGMLSRITSDAEYGAKPFVVVMSIFQIIVYFMSMSAAAPKDLPQALIFLIVTLVLAIVSLVFSVRICAKAVTYLQDRISVQTVHYSEQLANIRFIKASNGEEKAIARSKELIGLRYKASLYNAFATGLQTLSNNFTYIIIYSCAFLGGISAIKAHAISDMTPINAVSHWNWHWLRF